MFTLLAWFSRKLRMNRYDETSMLFVSYKSAGMERAIVSKVTQIVNVRCKRPVCIFLK